MMLHNKIHYPPPPLGALYNDWLIPKAEYENIVEPEDVSMAREIDHTLKIHKLERKCIQNGDTYINFFKNADHEDPSHVQW